MEATTQDTPATVPDDEQPEAIQTLLKKLDVIAENARYEADPRVSSQQIAQALAAYFRTPD